MAVLAFLPNEHDRWWWLGQVDFLGQSAESPAEDWLYSHAESKSQKHREASVIAECEICYKGGQTRKEGWHPGTNGLLVGYATCICHRLTRVWAETGSCGSRSAPVVSSPLHNCWAHEAVPLAWSKHTCSQWKLNSTIKSPMCRPPASYKHKHISFKQPQLSELSQCIWSPQGSSVLQGCLNQWKQRAVLQATSTTGKIDKLITWHQALWYYGHLIEEWMPVMSNSFN